MGTKQDFANGDRLRFGTVGEVSGRSTVGDGNDQKRVKLRLDGNKGPVTVLFNEVAKPISEEEKLRTAADEVANIYDAEEEKRREEEQRAYLARLEEEEKRFQEEDALERRRQETEEKQRQEDIAMRRQIEEQRQKWIANADQIRKKR